MTLFLTTLSFLSVRLAAQIFIHTLPNGEVTDVHLFGNGPEGPVRGGLQDIPHILNELPAPDLPGGHGGLGGPGDHLSGVPRLL